MIHHKFLSPLAGALRIYVWIALAVLLFQLAGLLTYFINVWPGVRDTIPAGVTRFVVFAVVLTLIHSGLWIRIYSFGAKTFSLLSREGESQSIADRLAPVLKTLRQLLVVSCFLDLGFVPALFLSGSFMAFPVSGLWLGFVYLTILLFPQAFGVAALILAFLARQYEQMLRERSQMKEEIELTI